MDRGKLNDTDKGRTDSLRDDQLFFYRPLSFFHTYIHLHSRASYLFLPSTLPRLGNLSLHWAIRAFPIGLAITKNSINQSTTLFDRLHLSHSRRLHLRASLLYCCTQETHMAFFISPSLFPIHLNHNSSV
jgi:hypothetical protein